MVSHPELSSDPPIRSDRESGLDKYCEMHDLIINDLLHMEVTIWI